MTNEEARKLKPLQWVKFYYDDKATKDGVATGIVMKVDKHPIGSLHYLYVDIMFIDKKPGNRFGFFENTFDADYIIKAGPIITDNPPKL